MDEIVKGVVLKTRDYKESDKVLTILTASKGKILIKARGVKKAKSKLKAFCQPFCFADFEITHSKFMDILTGARVVDMFFDLVQDYEKYSIASILLKLLDKICVEGQSYETQFVNSTRCLTAICYLDYNPKLAFIKFVLNLLASEGVGFNFDNCSSCRAILRDHTYLNLDTGEVVCENCKGFYNVKISKDMLLLLKEINGTDYENLKNINYKEKNLDETIKILFLDLKQRFDVSF